MSNADLENMLYAFFSLFGIGTTMLIPILIILGFIVMIAAILIVVMIIFGFPLYKMAKNAGFRHPIFAFIPFLQSYLMFFLPQEEFNLFNLIKIEDRHKAALYMTLIVNAPIILFVLIGLVMFVPFLGGIIASLISALSTVVSVAGYIVSWKCYMDLYQTYNVGENALLYSLLSLFVPIFCIVMLFMLMNKEPNYGFGNIYNVANENEVYS